MQSPYYNGNTSSVLISKPKSVNTSTPQHCNSVLINGKNQREPYHKTSPATTCQKDAAAGESLEKKQ